MYICTNDMYYGYVYMYICIYIYICGGVYFVTAHAVTRIPPENKNKNACCQKPKENKSPAAKMMGNKTIKRLRPRGWGKHNTINSVMSIMLVLIEGPRFVLLLCCVVLLFCSFLFS